MKSERERARRLQERYEGEDDGDWFGGRHIDSQFTKGVGKDSRKQESRSLLERMEQPSKTKYSQKDSETVTRRNRNGRTNEGNRPRYHGGYGRN